MDGDVVAFEDRESGKVAAALLVSEAIYLAHGTLLRGCLVDPERAAPTAVAFVTPAAPLVPLDGITLAAAA